MRNTVTVQEADTLHYLVTDLPATFPPQGSEISQGSKDIVDKDNVFSIWTIYRKRVKKLYNVTIFDKGKTAVDVGLVLGINISSAYLECYVSAVRKCPVCAGAKCKGIMYSREFSLIMQSLGKPYSGK